MKNVSGRICVVCSVAIALAVATATQASTFTVKPVTLNPICVAGSGLGTTCVRDRHCDSNKRCDGVGAACNFDGECGLYLCFGDGDGVCEGTEVTFTCVGGTNPGAACSSSADCRNGVCGPDALHEVAYLPTCFSIDSGNPVPNDGQPCVENSDCESAPGARDGFCVGDYAMKLDDLDVLVTEIYGSDWSPPGSEDPDEACRLWQFDVDVYNFMNGECDPKGVFPHLWDRPLDVIPCTADLDCPPQYPICDPLNICVGPNHHPEAGFFIDITRPDYIFHGFVDIPAVDHREWRAGSTDIQPGTEPLYEGVPKYLATMTFKVANGACGVFTIPIVVDGTDSIMQNKWFDMLTPFLAENLVIEVGVVPGLITAATPDNCDIDARQTREPDATGAQGWDTFEFQYRPTDDLDGITAGFFTVSRSPADPPFPQPPQIASLDVDNVGKTVTLYLNKPIDPLDEGRWTCIEWEPRGQKFCWGYLPGDVTNDRATAQNDIGAIINHLVDPGTYPLGLHQCDADRSGSCTGADLLRVIDLFQGGDPYDPWEGGSLATCPSTEPGTGAKRSPRPVR